MATVEKDLILDEEEVFVVDEEINEEPNEPEKKPRSRVPIYIVGGIVAAGAVIGLIWWLYARQFVTTDDAFIEGNITVVSPKISAYVVKIYVTENQFVKKGDLLLELDAQEAETKLAQAKAALQTALANRTKAEASVSLTRVAGRADVNQAKSNLQTTKSNVEQTRLASSSKQNDIEQARRQTTTAEANLRQVQAQVAAAKASIDQAKSQVNSAQSRFEVARLERDRDKRLFDGGIVSRQELDQSNRELSEAQAALVSAEKQVEITQSRLIALQRQIEVETSRLNEAKAKIISAESDYRQSLAQINLVASQADESAGRLQEANSLPAQIAVGQSDVEIAAAQVEQAQAAVNQAELELSYTKIYAPQDGYISRRAVQEGQLVQSEQTLMAVTQGTIWVVANFKETQIEKMKVGQAVDIYVDAYPSVAFRGKVDSFQAGTGSRFSVLPSENSSGNFVKVVQRIPVKVTFDETPDSAKYLLVPGMSVVPKVRVK